MKTHSLDLGRTFRSVAMAAIFALALSPASQAKDKGHGNPGHGNQGKHEEASHKHEQKAEQKFEKKFEHKAEPKFAQNFEHKAEPKFEQKFVPKNQHKDEHDRVVYMSRPRSSFVLSPGMGYAGRGYYYGPPNVPYYYEHPDVKFFTRREDFPRGYVLQPGYQSADDIAAVQQALARLGYYQGPIDGRIGPQTLGSIAQYEQDNGMSVTNAIVPALLQALGLPVNDP